jgi:hypothetical protein
MCTLSAIRLEFMIFSYAKAFISFYLFVAGCYFASSAQLHQGYGAMFAGYGAGLIIVGIVSGFAVIPFRWAIEKHNRFVLGASFLLDFIFMPVLISLSVNVGSHAVPLFPKDLQKDCLLNVPQVYSPAECQAYMASPRTAGFRLFWEGYFQTNHQTASITMLTQLQAQVCCGFFAPMGCVPITNAYPSSLVTTGIDSSYLDQVVSCGHSGGYYPQNDLCTVYYDEAAIPPIVGGCNYDMGISFCLNQQILPTASGCASRVEDYLASLVLPHSSLLLISSFFNLTGMLFACCMWWKRKSTDIFPEFKTLKSVS